MLILRAALLYFALVFGAGFVLGSMRVIWVVPRLGARIAEIAEMPIMLAVIFAAAKWTLRRYELASSQRLMVGCIAFAFLVVAEFSIVLSIRGLSIGEYLATRDPVAGAVYYLMLGVFAMMPRIIQYRLAQ
jgi:hypothetical protein